MKYPAIEVPIDVLSKCKRLITHDNCPDGLASAMIIRDALPDIAVLFIQYNTEVHKNLAAREGDIFCDFTPHKDTVEDFLQYDTIVLDHHKGAKELVEQFKYGMFACEKDDPGVSGALLAFQVWEKLQEEPDALHRAQVLEMATWAGIRDTWQKDDKYWLDACIQASALMFYDRDHYFHGHKPYITTAEFGIGVELVKKENRRASKVSRGAYRIGHFAVINSLSTSDVAEELRFRQEHNLCCADMMHCKALVGFKYITDSTSGELKLVFSLRSLGDYDVGALAKKFGGGGHTKAAGFSVDYENHALDSPLLTIGSFGTVMNHC